MTTQAPQAIRMSLWRLIRWTCADAAMGALCAGLFGMIYGGFDTLVHGEPSRILLAAGYSTLAGALAGAVLGAFGAILEAVDGSSTEPNATVVPSGNRGRLAHADTGTAKDRVFQRPTVLGNPLIARWKFIENRTENDSRQPTNGQRQPACGSTSTGAGLRLTANGPRGACELEQSLELPRDWQRVRCSGDDEAND